jgi:hypothetical protein
MSRTFFKTKDHNRTNKDQELQSLEFEKEKDNPLEQCHLQREHEPEEDRPHKYLLRTRDQHQEKQICHEDHSEEQNHLPLDQHTER